VHQVHISIINDPRHPLLCEMAERIEVLFGVNTFGELRNIVLDGSLNFSHRFVAAFDRLLGTVVLFLFEFLVIFIHCFLGCQNQFSQLTRKTHYYH